MGGSASPDRVTHRDARRAMTRDHVIWGLPSLNCLLLLLQLALFIFIFSILYVTARDIYSYHSAYVFIEELIRVLLPPTVLLELLASPQGDKLPS